MLQPDASDVTLPSSWLLAAAILVSGLASVVALSRIGMRVFWSLASRETPRLRLLEAAPVASMVLLCLSLTVIADPVTRYLGSAASSLHAPDTYIRTVLSQETRREKAGEPRP